MARKTTMWVTEDDVAMREALARASFVENVQIVLAARPTETGSSHNPFLNALVEMVPDTDSDWDTFFKSH
jgi:hypothetical protein